MSVKQIHIIMGTIVALLLLVFVLILCIVDVGDNDYVVLKRFDGSIEILDEEGIYFRPFNRSIVLPKDLLLKYYNENRKGTE